ncbi:MAG: NUDIX hydrolase [Ferruginibacter sp.]
MKVISSKKIYNGKWIQLHVDEIIKPDGTKATHELIKRADAVLIIPILNDNYYFVSQYRYPVNEVCIEFPTGFIEGNEDPMETAKRELKEEVGGEEGEIEYLGFIWSWAGLLTQRLHIFMVKNFTITEQELEASEKDLVVTPMKIKSVSQSIRTGEIKNSSTLAALTLLKAYQSK